MKTIEERVDILLREGIDRPKKWAAVHGYEEPMPPLEDYDERSRYEWIKLRDHHLAETTFLFDIIKELIKRIEK